MKKILLLIAIMLVGLFLHAQPIHYATAPLDYSNYHLSFYDEFEYPSLTSGTSISGTTVGTTFASNWFVVNDAWGGENEYYYPSQVTMPTPGIVRLTENILVDSFNIPNGSDTTWTGVHTSYCSSAYVYDYTCTCAGRHVSRASGTLFIDTTREFGYGIYEARIKFPAAATHPANPAFWINNGNTEIDIFDDAAYSDWLIYRVIDWSNYNIYGSTYYVGNNTQTAIYTPTETINDLTGWHIYSAEWTPDIVSFYIDGYLTDYVSYKDVRTYGQYPFKYRLITALLASASADDGQYMDVDWVKIWKQNCSASVLNVSSVTSSSVVTPGMYKNDQITSSSSSLISTDPMQVTIFESPSTTIQSNFIADESLAHIFPVYPPPAVPNNSNDSSYGPVYRNGYLLILPTNCTNDNTETGYRTTSSGNSNNYQNGISNAIGFNKTAITGDTTNNNLSINNIQLYTQIQVYPNPTQNNVTISYPCMSGGQLEIKINDVNGRVRYTEYVTCDAGNSVQHIVDLSAFPSGVYFLNLTLNDQHVVKKIVKL